MSKQENPAKVFLRRYKALSGRVDALQRAIEGYWNRDGWKALRYRAMTCDNSWSRSASDYINVYRDTIDNWK